MSTSDITAPRAETGLVDALRDDLSAADLTVGSVESLLGPMAAAALHRDEVLPAVRVVQRTAPATADPLLALTCLFILGKPVPRAVVVRALPGLGVDGAVRLGLVAVAGSADGDEVRPLVDLRPYSSTDAAGPAAPVLLDGCRRSGGLVARLRPG